VDHEVIQANKGIKESRESPDPKVMMGVRGYLAQI